MMSDRQGTWELGGTLAVGASEISQEPRSDESGLQTFRSSPDQKVGHMAADREAPQRCKSEK